MNLAAEYCIYNELHQENLSTISGSDSYNKPYVEEHSVIPATSDHSILSALYTRKREFEEQVCPDCYRVSKKGISKYIGSL